MTRTSGKMTLTINPQSYAQLLAFYQPKVIETEAENDRALSLAHKLEHKGDRTVEEDAILDLFVTLIEKFEEEYYPIPEASPHSLVLHLLDANDLAPDDLVEVLGSREAVAEVINGPFEISIAQAKTLASFFSVDASLFITTSESKQTLVEAAAEIQALLQQLEQNYSADSMTQKMKMATAAVETIEKNPSLKQKAVNALVAGGTKALEAAIDHPVAAFVVGAIEEWKGT